MPTKFTSTRCYLGLLLAALALAACATRASTPAPSIVLVSSTATTAASRTPAPMVTRTLSPTLTATTTSTRTPPPTRTRVATITPTSTFAPSLTPATPLGPEAYKLKDWAAQDALKAVAEADGILTAQRDDPNFDYFGYSDYFITIGRETARRFPVEVAKTNLYWRLGFYETWSWGLTYSVQDFRLALENSMNSGDLTLSWLDDWLDQHEYYLRVEATYTTTNLFGDGQTATVFQVGTSDQQSATFILTGFKPGDYHVSAPYDQWYGTYHQGANITVTDLNGNGQPEIQRVSGTGWYGMPFDTCTGQLALFEWQGPYPDGQFIDLAREVSGIQFEGMNIPDCDQSWEYGPRDESGSRSIASTSQHPIFDPNSKCATYKFRTEYRWNGLVYEWTSETANSTDDACATKMTTLSQLRSLHPATTDEMLEGLRKHGVPVRTIKPVDLNDDGVDDWLALIGAHNSTYWDLWAFIRVPSGLQSFPVQNSWYVSPDQFLANFVKQPTENSTTSIFLFAIGGNISTFQITEHQGVFAAQPYPLNSLNPELQSSLANYVNIALVEESLLELGNTAKALKQLQVISSRSSLSDPKLLYLLGLTYELSGDGANAVQTYWQLWRDYADNPYTFIARRKLELKP